jgi:uncharacterized membrane protein (UPF0127 family)
MQDSKPIFSLLKGTGRFLAFLTLMMMMMAISGVKGYSFFGHACQYNRLAKASNLQNTPQKTCQNNMPRKNKGLPTATLTLGRYTYRLEVANTPEAAQTGLMNRVALRKREGMAFPFKTPQVVSFWMAHTLIPLDILFFHQRKLVYFIRGMTPCNDSTTVHCPYYSSTVPVDLAIELPAGTIRHDQIQLGTIADMSICETLKDH